jgi:hypothetical protein
MAAKSRRPKAQGPLRRYRLLIVAVTLFWAAMNEPPVFGIGAVSIWLCSAAAVAFLTCAAIVLLAPAVVILMQMRLRQAPSPPAAAETPEP